MPSPYMTTSMRAGDISLRQKRKVQITDGEVRDYKLTGCLSSGACAFWELPVPCSVWLRHWEWRFPVALWHRLP